MVGMHISYWAKIGLKPLFFGGGFFALLAMTFATSYFYNQGRQAEIANLQREIEAERLKIETAVEARFQSLIALTQSATSHVQGLIREDIPTSRVIAGESWFNDRLAQQFPSLRTIVTIGTSGIIRNDTRPKRNGVGINVSDRDYFKVHLGRKALVESGLYVSKPVVSRVDKKWTWVVSAPAFTRDGQLALVTAASVDRRFFNLVFNKVAVSNTRSYALVHGNDVILEASPNLQELIGAPASILEEQFLVFAPDRTETSNRSSSIRVISAVSKNYFEHKLSEQMSHVTIVALAVGALITLLTYLGYRIAEQSRVAQLYAETLSRDAQKETGLAIQANTAKSEFLASMSHELRTPLNAILGYAQMLQLGVKGHLLPEQKAMADNIFTGASHLLRLVEDVMDLARIESSQLRLDIEIIDANDVISECIKWIGPRCANRQIRIEDNFSGGQKIRVKSDKTRLAQVVTNLLSNAEKYNVDGGLIRIDGQVSHNGYLKILVADSGIGIDPTVGTDVFNLFSRAVSDPHIAGGGAGIGLGVSRSIVERLGGWIDYESTLGKGSTFWITVPLVENEEVLIWTDDLRVGVDEIDKDHQRIFALTNRASRIGIGDDRVAEVIEGMIAYTRYHFKREEVIMEAVGYPDLNAHCKYHRRLEEEVEAHAVSWREKPNAENLHELQRFLRDWWRHHILATDMSIAEYAEGKRKSIRDALMDNGLEVAPMLYD